MFWAFEDLPTDETVFEGRQRAVKMELLQLAAVLALLSIRLSAELWPMFAGSFAVRAVGG